MRDLQKEVDARYLEQQRGMQALPEPSFWRGAQTAGLNQSAVWHEENVRHEVQALKAELAALKAQRVPMSEKPNMCRIAQFKLDTLKAEGFVVNGYAIQRASPAGGWQRGFITEGGMVGWWADPETTQAHHNIQEVKP